MIMDGLSEKELLNFALQNGMIDIDTIQKKIEMNERKKYLEMNKYDIWLGRDGYYHTYIPQGDGKRKAVKKKNKEDIENLIVNYWESKKSNSFKARFDVWVERQRNCGRSGNTIYKYRADYKRFFEGYPIENMEIGKISDEVLAKHIKLVLEEKEIPYKALKEAFGYVRGTFDKAIIDKVIAKAENPCDYIDLPIFKKYCKQANKKTASERTLSDSERKFLLEKLHNPINHNVNAVANFAVELSLYTGMRVGELSALKWEDVRESEGIIIIQRSEKRNRETGEYTISTTKNDKVRYFPITESICDVLSRIKEYEKLNGFLGEFVFQDSGGRLHASKISNSARNKTMSDEFGNVKSIHAIRRTLNSNLRCAGVSATVASSLLGHTEKVNEENYTYDTSSLEAKEKYVSEAGKI